MDSGFYDYGECITAVEICGAAATERIYGIVLPVPQERILQTQEGSRISLAGDTRTGHVFAGDTFGPISPSQFDPPALHRSIELALKYADSGCERHANLTRGVRQIVHAEAVRQGWTLPENDALEVFKLDIELNAQGLGAWLDSNTRGKEPRSPSENR